MLPDYMVSCQKTETRNLVVSVVKELFILCPYKSVCFLTEECNVMDNREELIVAAEYLIKVFFYLFMTHYKDKEFYQRPSCLG
jgi:hypothetical protein